MNTQNTIKKELKTIYDNAKNFYKKAYYFTDVDSSEKLLQSYGVDIATISAQGDAVRIVCNLDDLTQTTLRHLKEFIKQFANAQYFYKIKKDFKNAILTNNGNL